jgi:hypothetical protein
MSCLAKRAGGVHPCLPLRSPHERRLHLDDQEVRTEGGDQVHLSGVIHAARGLPIEQRRESTRLEQPGETCLNPSRLIPSVSTTSAESPQVVDRGRAVVLQANDPWQLNQRRAEPENRPLEYVGLKTQLITLEALCHRNHVVGPEVQDCRCHVGLPLGSDAVTVHPVISGHLRVPIRPGERQPVLTALPAVRPWPGAAVPVTQSPDASRRSAKAARKSCWKKTDIKLSDSSAWKRLTVWPDSALTSSSTPYASRKRSCACSARNQANRFASAFSGRPIVHRAGSEATCST